METQDIIGPILVYPVAACFPAAMLFRRKRGMDAGCRKAGPFCPGAHDDLTDSTAVAATACIPGL